MCSVCGSRLAYADWRKVSEKALSLHDYKAKILTFVQNHKRCSKSLITPETNKP